MQLNTLFSAIPKFFSFFHPPFQPKSLPFTLPHPVLHGSNLNNIKSYSTHPLAYPLDIEFSVSTTGAYVFRILLLQPYLISTTLRYGPRISRAALAKPDGYSNLLVLLVLISLILRPERRNCPIGAIRKSAMSWNLENPIPRTWKYRLGTVNNLIDSKSL